MGIQSKYIIMYIVLLLVIGIIAIAIFVGAGFGIYKWISSYSQHS